MTGTFFLAIMVNKCLECNGNSYKYFKLSARNEIGDDEKCIIILSVTTELLLNITLLSCDAGCVELWTV